MLQPQSNQLGGSQERQRDIVDETKRLEGTINDLEGAVNVLREQLASALKPVPPSPEAPVGKPVMPSLSPVAEGLRTGSNRLSAVLNNIHDLIRATSFEATRFVTTTHNRYIP